MKRVPIREMRKQAVYEHLLSLRDKNTGTICVSDQAVGEQLLMSEHCINGNIKQLIDEGKLMQLRHGRGKTKSVYCVPPPKPPEPTPAPVQPELPIALPDLTLLADRELACFQSMQEMLAEQRRTNALLQDLLAVWGAR